MKRRRHEAPPAPGATVGLEDGRYERLRHALSKAVDIEGLDTPNCWTVGMVQEVAAKYGVLPGDAVTILVSMLRPREISAAEIPEQPALIPETE